jgi:uncharacterized protein DUF4350
MNALSRRGLISAGVVLALLTAVNLWMRPDFELQLSPTSFGVGPDGYKAAFDLAAELGVPVMRSYVSPKQQPLNRQIWMVSPSLLGTDSAGGDTDAHELLDWVRAGGTAVVFGGTGNHWKRLEINADTVAGTEHTMISGEFAPVVRRLSVSGLLHFNAAGKDASVRLRADNTPFAIERKIGKGRLIAIADDRFLRNGNLGNADNSLLFMDLIRRFDAPAFDEHCHGMVGDVSLVRVVATSRAMLPLGAGFVLAVAWIFAQRAWPRRILACDSEGPQPSLVSFVESLGVLYSRASDPPAAFRAYRSGFLRRLRRQMMPFGELDEEVLLTRIASDRALSDETRRWLLMDTAPKSDAELVDAVRALESYPEKGHE